jgi:hypothetical protein
MEHLHLRVLFFVTMYVWRVPFLFFVGGLCACVCARTARMYVRRRIHTQRHTRVCVCVRAREVCFVYVCTGMVTPTLGMHVCCTHALRPCEGCMKAA